MLSHVFTRLGFTAFKQQVVVLGPDFPGHHVMLLASGMLSVPSKSWREAVFGDGREQVVLHADFRLSPHPRIRPARATTGVVLTSWPPLRQKHHAWLDQLEAVKQLGD